MEKMKLAMKKEEERLAEYHQYEDGTVDQPFLTPDTVKVSYEWIISYHTMLVSGYNNRTRNNKIFRRISKWK